MDHRYVAHTATFFIAASCMVITHASEHGPSSPPPYSAVVNKDMLMVGDPIVVRSAAMEYGLPGKEPVVYHFTHRVDAQKLLCGMVDCEEGIVEDCVDDNLITRRKALGQLSMQQQLSCDLLAEKVGERLKEKLSGLFPLKNNDNKNDLMGRILGPALLEVRSSNPGSNRLLMTVAYIDAAKNELSSVSMGRRVAAYVGIEGSEVGCQIINQRWRGTFESDVSSDPVNFSYATISLDSKVHKKVLFANASWGRGLSALACRWMFQQMVPTQKGVQYMVDTMRRYQEAMYTTAVEEQKKIKVPGNVIKAQVPESLVMVIPLGDFAGEQSEV